jgi:hypothetical protein
MKKLWGLGAVLALLAVGSMRGQLSQSGGAGNSVSATQAGTWTVVPKTACGATVYDSGMVTVPASSTVVTATATCVNGIVFVNTTGQSQTISVTDNQATPMTYLFSFAIPANSTFVYDLEHAKFAAGVRWSATNAGSVNAQIVGFQ